MDRKTLIMLILREAEESKPKSWRGRTFLQKVVYFVNHRHKLGIEYRPHYFGPYSEELAASCNSAVAIGLIRERCDVSPLKSEKPFEAVRYDYRLTAGGKRVLDNTLVNLKEEEKEQLNQTRETIKKILMTKANYQSLSVAAKTYHIITKGTEEGPIEDIEQVRKEAEKLGWSVSEDAVKKGVSLLMELMSH